MAVILTGYDAKFADWAARRIPAIKEAKNFGQHYAAVGVATGQSADDRLMAVVIFHEYIPQYATCQVSVASADPRWATRKTLRALLSIPFLQKRCNKVWAAVPHTSPRVVQFAKAIGFTPEATLKDQFGRGVNGIILRMMTRDYDKLYWKETQEKAA